MVQPYIHNPVNPPRPSVKVQTGQPVTVKPGAGSAFRGTSAGGSILSRIVTTFKRG